MKDQWDCVLNDLEELGDQEFLVLMDQYKMKSFLVTSASCHFALPHFHQTNDESAQIRSEDTLLFYRKIAPSSSRGRIS